MPRPFLLLLALAFCSWLTSDCLAKTLLIEGVGNRSTFGEGVGVPGETVTITIELDSQDFFYRSVANPAFHYFEPIGAVPVSVVGEFTGAYPQVSPIDDFLALELTGSGSDDQVSLGVASGNSSTTLLKYFCDSASCFDGDVTPFTAEQMFDLFLEAANDDANWSLSGALSSVFAGPQQDLISFTNVDWSVTDPDGPQSIDLLPTFDVAYTIGTSIGLVEGEASMIVGGITGHPQLPEERPIMEFPLDALPAGARIESATLSLDTFVSSGAPRIEVTGYAGDGYASLLDASVAGPILATTDEVSATTNPMIDLDPAYIESLLGGASHLGLRLQSLDGPEYVGFATSETTSSVSTPPTLSIQYSVSGQPGDFNDDGVVDAADYAVWRDGLGSSYGPGDYHVWQDNYGAGAPSSEANSQSAAVPEPSAWFVLVSLVGCLAAQRRF